MSPLTVLIGVIGLDAKRLLTRPPTADSYYGLTLYRVSTENLICKDTFASTPTKGHTGARLTGVGRVLFSRAP